MNNEELIKALRNCSDGFCSLCPFDDYELSTKECEAKLMLDASDALEAAEKRIAEIQQIADHYEQTAKDYWKEACEYKQRIAELEAQLPKQGKWISDLPNGLFENVNPWKCSACGKHQHFREDYCPNCGAKMRKGERNEK